MINQKMKEDLIKIGLKSDDTVMVHSSLSSLGYVEGGADTVIDTLLSVLEKGTLLMPALSYDYVTDDNPVFSIDETKSCVGKISEVFRRRAGVIRSMHPTHSVCAYGKYAEEMLAGHIDTDTPAGDKSPFALLPKYNGKILMLGCGLKKNTSFHAIEELVRPCYLMRDVPVLYTLIDKDGNETKKEYERHNFKNTSQCYDRISGLMDIPCGKVLGSEAWLIDAAKMWDTALEMLKKDSCYFVDLGSGDSH